MGYAEYTGRGTDFYETTDEVAEIVNIAAALGRPILVEGEAGCGKTMLASSIARELGLGDPTVIPVKSTSQAKDLLYRFDALRRLQEVQDPNSERARYVYPYITLQPLGRAIQRGEPGVVLIDEVDKADIDFPNDLLDVLDRFAFDIEDLPAEEDEACLRNNGFGRHVEGRGGVRPIMVITSNREKQLPEPFLRRCLYLQLRFPEEEDLLARIVKKNLGVGIETISAELIGAAVTSFLAVRREAIAAGMQKPPATSELVDWIKMLHWKGPTAEEMQRSGGRPPYWRLLFKTMQDLQAYEARTDRKTE